MTALQPEIPVTGPLRSLEARWILPGPLEPAVTRWFARFPAEVSSREDTYLVDPQLGGLSAKLRGGRTFEVKVYRGSPGILQVTGRAFGRLESWDKWSFAGEQVSSGGADLTGWRPVHKLISRFSPARGHSRTRARELGEEPGCHVELTEVPPAGHIVNRVSRQHHRLRGTSRSPGGRLAGCTGVPSGAMMAGCAFWSPGIAVPWVPGSRAS
jgi:hypothetical protein